MKHFVFATMDEAQYIIKNIQVKSKINSSYPIYQKNDSHIFICGIGKICHNNIKTYINSSYFNKKNDSIINIGIAGACETKLSLEKTYAIKKVINEKNDSISLNYIDLFPQIEILCTKSIPLWEKKNTR